MAPLEFQTLKGMVRTLAWHSWRFPIACRRRKADEVDVFFLSLREEKNTSVVDLLRLAAADESSDDQKKMPRVLPQTYRRASLARDARANGSGRSSDTESRLHFRLVEESRAGRRSEPIEKKKMERKSEGNIFFSKARPFFSFPFFSCSLTHSLFLLFYLLSQARPPPSPESPSLQATMALARSSAMTRPAARTVRGPSASRDDAGAGTRRLESWSFLFLLQELLFFFSASFYQKK